MDSQQTIRRPVSLDGIGLHSGETVKMTLSPAAADTGILFRAADGTLIPANAEHVVDTHSATTVGAFGVRVRTIEHLMAAAAALGIDNLMVDIDGPEVPAADGSAKPFVDLLRSAGRVSLRSPSPSDHDQRADPRRGREPLDRDRCRRTRSASATPSTTTIRSSGCRRAPSGSAKRSSATSWPPARTYGFLRDVPAMRQNGLARGGSLDNAIVVGKRSVLNDSLRFPDEFVRHKILDLVGDLFLLGRPLRAHVVGRNAGHALNYQLVAAIQKALAADRRRVAARATRQVPAPVAAGDGFLPGVAAL